jgi:hypothetical protein
MTLHSDATCMYGLITAILPGFAFHVHSALMASRRLESRTFNQLPTSDITFHSQPTECHHSTGSQPRQKQSNSQLVCVVWYPYGWLVCTPQLQVRNAIVSVHSLCSAVIYTHRRGCPCPLLAPSENIPSRLTLLQNRSFLLSTTIHDGRQPPFCVKEKPR